MNSDLRPRKVFSWFCPSCGQAAWGCAEQYDHWKTIHKCKGDGVTIQEEIAKAKERLKAQEARLKLLEEKEARGPQRKTRSPEEIQQIVRLEDELRKQYGAGYAGLAEVVRKAKKAPTAAEPPTETSVGEDEPPPEAVPAVVPGEPGEDRPWD